MNIYVSNLGFDLHDEDLKNLFTPYGEVSSAKVILDKMTERSRGFGFIEMTDETAAKKAMTELNGAVIGGRPIKVNEAKPREGRDSGGRGERNFNNPGSYNQTRY